MGGQNPMPGGQPVPVPKIVYVLFTAQIDAKTTEGLLAVMANCATQRVAPVMNPSKTGHLPSVG